ncbi:unnamed protein product, partial [marine sediment metagenome]
VQAHAPSQPFLEEFQHFNLSVKQKMWSVDYFHNQINELKPEVLYQQQRTRGSTLVLREPYINKEGFGLYANLVLDGFLMNAMAALDTLAHEIRVLYTFQPVPQDVYIRSIKQRLEDQHPYCTLTKYLSDELTKPWFDPFANYRHCTTHESLVGSNVRYDEALITGDRGQAFITLPDDPRNRPFTYSRNRELKSYCVKIRGSVTDLVRHSYYCIIQDIRVAQNILPIP